jgi:hypothetical protein
MASHIEHAQYEAPEITHQKRSGGMVSNVVTPILAAIVSAILIIVVMLTTGSTST